MLVRSSFCFALVERDRERSESESEPESDLILNYASPAAKESQSLFSRLPTMESNQSPFPRKRLKPATEDEGGEEGTSELLEKAGMETHVTGSEDMELNISHILEKIQHFTQLVSELLESGKSIFKELSDEFEERMIAIHKERIEKWQEEIKELRSLDASNEEANALLHNARYLLQNAHTDS